MGGQKNYLWNKFGQKIICPKTSFLVIFNSCVKQISFESVRLIRSDNNNDNNNDMSVVEYDENLKCPISK